MVNLPVMMAAAMTILLIMTGVVLGGYITLALLEYYGNHGGANRGSSFDYTNPKERRCTDGNKTQEPEDHQG